MGHVFCFIIIVVIIGIGGGASAAMLLSIASAGVAFIPPINVFHSSILHPSLEIKQKIHKTFHNILPSIIFSQ